MIKKYPSKEDALLGIQDETGSEVGIDYARYLYEAISPYFDQHQGGDFTCFSVDPETTFAIEEYIVNFKRRSARYSCDQMHVGNNTVL